MYVDGEAGAVADVDEDGVYAFRKLDVLGDVDHPNKAVLVATEEFAKGTLCLVPWTAKDFLEKEPANKKA